MGVNARSSVVAIWAAMASSAQLGFRRTLVLHQGLGAVEKSGLASCAGVSFGKRFAPVTLNCRRIGGRFAGAGVVKSVVSVENYITEASSLGEITKGDFPILDQVCTWLFFCWCGIEVICFVVWRVGIDG